MPTLNPFLLAHVGAGNHSLLNRARLKGLLKRALETNDLESASIILESSLLTNTGYGSSLDLEGNVSCDASFMIIESSRCTRLGAAHNIRRTTPIKETIDLFGLLMKRYRQNELGLTQPVLIDFERADILMGGVKGSKDLISSQSKIIYDKNLSRIQNFHQFSPPTQEVSDTIGLINVNENITTLATSLGGNFFKIPGRVGCAATIGAAIWSCYRDGYQVSVMCSGNGEDIIMMNLAREISQKILLEYDEDRDITVSDSMVRICEAHGDDLLPMMATDQKGSTILYMGVICILHNTTTHKISLAFCHSTESFMFGYKTLIGRPEIVFSTLNKSGEFARGEVKIQ